MDAARQHRLALLLTLRAWRQSVRNGRPISEPNLRRLHHRHLEKLSSDKQASDNIRL